MPCRSDTVEELNTDFLLICLMNFIFDALQSIYIVDFYHLCQDSNREQSGRVGAIEWYLTIIQGVAFSLAKLSFGETIPKFFSCERVTIDDTTDKLKHIHISATELFT